MSDVEHTETPHEAPENRHEGEEIRNTLPLIPQLSIALGILVVIFGLSYFPFFTEKQTNTSPATDVAQVATALESKSEEAVDPFAETSIEAEAAYVWDVKNQKALYRKNADAQLPLASLTKLMTALVASEHLRENDTVQIDLDAINQYGESGFRDGSIFSFESLTDLTLMTSSNDGAYALAVAAGTVIGSTRSLSPTEIFMAAMNKKAEEIGLSQTYFTNPTGLDRNDTESGSYGSARDMAFLMEHIIVNAPKIFERTTEDVLVVHDESATQYNAHNTNMLTDQIPGLIASKTGYTTLAGGNLVVAFDAGLNHPIIISVLGSSRNGRFTDVETLVADVQKSLTK